MYSFLTLVLLFLTLLFPSHSFAEQVLMAHRIKAAPTIDGMADEGVWQKAKSVRVHDPVAGIDIDLKAVHDGKNIFLLSEFPDAEESRMHRELVWNPDQKHYENGPSREDCFVVKWSMSGSKSGLTLKEDRPYRADIWYWKAHRTDHAGYADDKMHLYTSTRNQKAKLLLSESGRVFYLLRAGDHGDPAYKPKLLVDYAGDSVAKYDLFTPTDSRADVRAKGHWQDGRWVIEFSRQLNTGHSDDLQMDIGESYQFAVSRYELAGRDPEPESDQPLYGSGEVSEPLLLRFQP
ncbi:MAG TPA: ethylbenzene dehydrogenase-related protein [Geopsychrobacteraceae bacterium]|nr:ethylbenzene dehydrogenase-related protein [Geopsychrobacteraceae bacterium]